MSPKWLSWNYTLWRHRCPPGSMPKRESIHNQLFTVNLNHIILNFLFIPVILSWIYYFMKVLVWLTKRWADWALSRSQRTSLRSQWRVFFFSFYLWVILGLLLKLGPFQEISPWVSKGGLLITRPVCVKAQNKARGPVDSWRTIEDRKSIEKQILQKTPTVKYIQFELIIQVRCQQIDRGLKLCSKTSSKLFSYAKLRCLRQNWVIFRTVLSWKRHFLYGKIKCG